MRRLSLVIFSLWFLPLLLSMPVFEVQNFVIVISVYFAFLIGSLVATKAEVNNNHRYDVDGKVIFTAVILYLTFRFTYIVQVIGAIFSGSFAAFAFEQAISRYEGGGEVDSYYNIGTIFLNLSFVFFGIFFSNRVKFKAGAMALLIVMLFMCLIESSALARAGLLMAFVLFFVFYAYNKRTTIAKMSFYCFAKIIFVIITLTFFIFIFSAYLRLSERDDVSSTLVEKMSVYFLAGHQAFFVWLNDFDNYFINFERFGFNTFAFIYKLFGHSVKQGFYDPVQTRYGDTNVFLMLRNIYADFGILLAPFIMMLISWCVASLDHKTSSFNRFTGLSALTLVCFPINSPFVFTTFALGLSGSFLFIRNSFSEESGFEASDL